MAWKVHFAIETPFDPMPATSSDLLVVPSAQLDANGHARFRVVPSTIDDDIERLALQEQDGGVDAEFRLFLEAQLETEDLFVDLAPQHGFVLLTAATHAATPRVLACTDDHATAQLVTTNAQLNALQIDVRSIDEALLALSSGVLWDPAAAQGRMFARIDALTALSRTMDLRALAAAPGFTALLVALDAETARFRWHELSSLLRRVGLTAHVLVDTDDGPSLVQAREAAASIIALPTALAVDGTAVSTTTAPVATSINFIAAFCRTGYGITGANLLRALSATETDLAFFPLGGVDATIADVPRLPEYLDRAAFFDDHAPSIRLSQQFDLAFHVGRGPRIGFPIFEIDRFTARELHHLRHNDRLLVCSAWAYDVLRANDVDVPVSIVPLGVDRRIFHEHVVPASSSTDTVFVQVGKIEPRKGQLDLLRAFEAAFSPTDAVRLRLYCHNPFVSSRDLDALLVPFRSSPMASRIEIVTAALPTQHDVARAMMAADCGVFCSRAEGWNLEALEMLSLGKTVIATDYSAHTEFLNAGNARLVPVTAMEPQGPGSWAAFGNAELDALVHHLRAVHEARRHGPLPVNEAGIETARHYSWEHAAECLIAAVRDTLSA